MLKYEDRDGDLITLSSQDDLMDLLQYATTDSINVIVSESTSLPQLNLKGSISQQNLQRTPGAVLVPSSSVSVKDGPAMSKPGGVFNVAASAGSASSGPSPANAPFPRQGQVIIPRVERFPSISDSNRYQEQAPPLIRWKRAEMLGQGAFGVVYLGLNIDTGELMAVKQMATEEVSKRELGSLENEINLLRNLRHPNIVRYIGTELTNSALSIFLEYVPGGSLKALIDKFGALEESVARSYTRQLLLGLEYLHRNGIAHRDIKGANCLVGNDGVIKLADFGNSKHWRPVATNVTGGANFTQTGDIKGTPAWMAPEVVKDQSSTISWRKADIWSLGCTTLEMTTGKTPWSQFNNSVTVLYHLACQDTLPEYPTNPSVELRTFLNLCFQRDPTVRPDATSLLLHPFVAPQQSWGQVRPTTMSSLMVHSDGDFHQHMSRGSAIHQSIAQLPPRRNPHHNAPVSASQVRDTSSSGHSAKANFGDHSAHMHMAPRTMEQPQTARDPSSNDTTTTVMRDRLPNTARDVIATGMTTTVVNASHVRDPMASSFMFYDDGNPENTHERVEIEMEDPRIDNDGSTMRDRGHSTANESLPLSENSVMFSGEERPGTNSLTVEDSFNSPLPILMEDGIVDGGDRDSSSPSPFPVSGSHGISSSTPSQRSIKKNVGSGRKQGGNRKSSAATVGSAQAGVETIPTSSTETLKMSKSVKANSSKPKATVTSAAVSNPQASASKKNAATAATSGGGNSSSAAQCSSPSNLPNANAAGSVRRSSPSFKPSPLTRDKSASTLVTQSVSNIASSPVSMHKHSNQQTSNLLPPSSSLQSVPHTMPNGRVLYDSDDGMGGSASSYIHAQDTDNESSLLYADDELGSVDGAPDGGSLIGDASQGLLPTAESHLLGYATHAEPSRASSIVPTLISPRLESPRLEGSIIPPNSARALLNPIDPATLHHQVPSPAHHNNSIGKDRHGIAPSRPIISLKEPAVGQRAVMEMLSVASSPVVAPNRLPSNNTNSQPVSSISQTVLKRSNSLDWQDSKDDALEVEEEEQVSRQFHSSFGEKGGRQSKQQPLSLKGTMSSIQGEIQEDIDGDTFVDLDHPDADVSGLMIGQGSLLLESIDKLHVLDVSSADPTPVVQTQFRTKEGRNALNKSLELTANDLLDNAMVPISTGTSNVKAVASNPSCTTSVSHTTPASIGSPYQRQHKASGRNASSTKQHAKDVMSASGGFAGDGNGNVVSSNDNNNNNGSSSVSKNARKSSSRRTNPNAGSTNANRANMQTRGTGDNADIYFSGNGNNNAGNADILDMSCDSLESLHVAGTNMGSSGNASTNASGTLRSSLQSRQLQPATTTMMAMMHGLHQPQPPLNKTKSFSGVSADALDYNNSFEVNSGSGDGIMMGKGTIDSIHPIPSISELLRHADPVILDDHQGAVTRLRAPRRAPQLLVSSSMDGTVRLWSTTGGHQYESGVESGLVQKLVLSVDGFAFGAMGTSSTSSSSAGGSTQMSGENRRVVSLGAKVPSMDEGDVAGGPGNDNNSLTGSLTGQSGNHNAGGPSFGGGGSKSIKITDVWTEDTAETIWGVCSDGCVRLWSVNSNTGSDGGWHQRPLRVLKGHEDGITCIAGLDASSSCGPQASTMSNTTSMAATGSMDRTIRLWDARARKPQVFLLRGHGDTVLSLAWSEEGRALISGGKDRMIKIWDTRAGRLRCTSERHFGAVHTIRSLASNPVGSNNNNGSGAGAGGGGGGGNNNEIFFNSHTRGTSAGGSMMMNASGVGLVSHYNQENALSFVSVGRDAMINFWNFSGDCISSQTAHRGNTLCMSNISTTTSIFGSSYYGNNHSGVPMPPMLVTAGADSLMKIWDLRRARCAAEIATSAVSSMQTSNQGNVNKLVWTSPSSFVAGFTGGVVRLYEKDWQAGAVAVSTAADPTTAASDWQAIELKGQLGSACTDVVTCEGFVACSGKNGRILRWRLSSSSSSLSS
jgi:serine/threonine protein kinase/WD40 repeat protein